MNEICVSGLFSSNNWNHGQVSVLRDWSIEGKKYEVPSSSLIEGKKYEEDGQAQMPPLPFHLVIC